MDMNAFMKAHLEQQGRIATALEVIANRETTTVTKRAGDIELTIKTDTAATQGVVEATKAVVEASQELVKDAQAEADAAKGTSAKGEASAPSVEQAKASEPSSQTGASESAEKTAATPSASEKPKRATGDQGREALRQFAKVEGNAAAMELVSGLGHPSVSALEAASTDENDLLAKLIALTKGVAQ